MIDSALILISILFGLYGLASAVECGLVLKMLVKDRPAKTMFTPLWEITNVLLVFGITALVMLFNNALKSLSHDLMAVLGIALFTMLLRSCLVLSIFYIKDEPYLSRKLVLPLAASTFLVPLTFGAAGIFLLTGQMFWQTGPGLVCIALEAVSLPVLGLMIVGRERPQLSFITQLLYMTWLLILGCILPLVVSRTLNYWQVGPLSVLGLLSLVGLLVALLNDDKSRHFKTWHYGVLVSLVTLPLLAWADRPYLISGKLTLTSAYGAQTYGSVVVLGLLITLPIILIGLYLFIKFYGLIGKD